MSCPERCDPAPGEHRLVIHFDSDGGMDFFPSTDDPAELARRLAELVRVLVEHPSAIAYAAGHHEDRQ
jgi:hypothetical protein